MPLTFSPPPGTPEYCNAGKLLNRVITLLSGFFAMPVFFQPRILTGNKVKADRTATCSVITPGNLSIRGVVAGISFRSDSNVDPGIDVNTPSVSSRFQEKFNLKGFFN